MKLAARAFSTFALSMTEGADACIRLPLPDGLPDELAMHLLLLIYSSTE